LYLQQISPKIHHVKQVQYSSHSLVQPTHNYVRPHFSALTTVSTGYSFKDAIYVVISAL